MLSKQNTDFDLDIDVITASNVKYLEGNIRIHEITDYVECQDMYIKSNIFPRIYKSSEYISLPYLSVFQYDKVSNKFHMKGLDGSYVV